MNSTRYTYRTVPLPEARAEELRDAEIANELHEIERRRGQILECEQHIARLISEPLPTTRKEQISLNPGDPGYDETPPSLSPAQYQGDIKWINQ